MLKRVNLNNGNFYAFFICRFFEKISCPIFTIQVQFLFIQLKILYFLSLSIHALRLDLLKTNFGKILDTGGM